MYQSFRFDFSDKKLNFGYHIFPYYYSSYYYYLVVALVKCFPIFLNFLYLLLSVELGMNLKRNQDEFVKEKLTIGKTHFIFVSMDNYNEKDSVHEGVLIIHNKTAYYINSHGKWSPKEQNGVEYKKPIDYIFLKYATISTK